MSDFCPTHFRAYVPGCDVCSGIMRQKYRSLAPARCSAARRTVETAQELRDFLRPFTDECPVTFEDGRPLYIAYKIDADSNGKIFAGVVRQNSDIRRVLPDPVQLKS